MKLSRQEEKLRAELVAELKAASQSVEREPELEAEPLKLAEALDSLPSESQ